jgi:hypothetical protein
LKNERVVVVVVVNERVPEAAKAQHIQSLWARRGEKYESLDKLITTLSLNFNVKTSILNRIP